MQFPQRIGTFHRMGTARFDGLLLHEFYDHVTSPFLPLEDQVPLAEAISRSATFRNFSTSILEGFLIARGDATRSLKEYYSVRSPLGLVSYAKHLDADLLESIFDLRPSLQYVISQRVDAAPDLFDRVLRRALDLTDLNLASEVARSARLDEEAQWALHQHSITWPSLAVNPNLHPSVKHALMESDDPEVLSGLGRRQDLTSAEFGQLVARSDLRARLLTRPDLTWQQWVLLQAEPGFGVARAARTVASAPILEDVTKSAFELWEQGDARVVTALASNAHLPTETANRLYDLGEAGVTRTIARSGLLDVRRTMEVVRAPRANSNFDQDLAARILHRLDLSLGERLEVAVVAAESNQHVLASVLGLPWREWGLDVPVSLLRSHFPALLVEYHSQSNVPREVWDPLSENWAGSVHTLVEACRLVERW